MTVQAFLTGEAFDADIGPEAAPITRVEAAWAARDVLQPIQNQTRLALYEVNKDIAARAGVTRCAVTSRVPLIFSVPKNYRLSQKAA